MLVIMLIAALVLGIVVAALPHVVWLLAWVVGKWGCYDEDRQTLNVNAGLGCTLPVRLNCPAEITLITLHKK